MKGTFELEGRTFTPKVNGATISEVYRRCDLTLSIADHDELAEFLKTMRENPALALDVMTLCCADDLKEHGWQPSDFGKAFKTEEEYWQAHKALLENIAFFLSSPVLKKQLQIHLDMMGTLEATNAIVEQAVQKSTESMENAIRECFLNSADSSESNQTEEHSEKS